MKLFWLKENNMIENKKDFKLIPKKNPKSLLPNALTIFGVCLGLSSIKFAIDLNYSMAVIAIGFAAILDTLESHVKITGCTVHLVDQEIDSGEIIIQAALPVQADDDEISLLSSVQHFEHRIISLGIGLAARKWRDN